MESIITNTQMAWMAAIFDYKGALVEKRNSKRATPQLVMLLQSIDLTIIQRLCDLTGIMPGDKRPPHNFDRRACKDHCPEPHVHSEENEMPQVGQWAMTGVAAGIILHNLRPYMVRGGDEDLVKFTHQVLEQGAYSGQGSGKTKEAVLRLHKLGWDLPPVVLDRLLSTDVPGGRAPSIVLSCGHQRSVTPIRPDYKIWCQPCHEYRRSVTPVRKAS